MRYITTALLLGALCVPGLHAKGKKDSDSSAVSAEQKAQLKDFMKSLKAKRKAFHEEMKAKKKAFRDDLQKQRESFIAQNPELQALVKRRTQKMFKRTGRKGKGMRAHRCRDKKSEESDSPE